MESVDCNTEPCKQYLERFTLFQLPKGILLFHNQICQRNHIGIYHFAGGGTGIGYAEITAATPTNWDKPGVEIRYDRDGLLGNNYGGLRVNFDFGKPTPITGMETDYMDNSFMVKELFTP